MRKIKLLLVNAIVISTNWIFAQNVTIPDANFKNYLLSNSTINTVDDKEISVTEAEAFTGQIDVSNKNISSLKGIEAFINITGLYCQENKIENIDVSNNTALKTLWCFTNQLTQLDVSKNKALEYLNCPTNKIEKLDVTTNVNLKYLYCGENNLETLDVTNNVNLEDLRCGDNNLKTLDVSKNTALNTLRCYTNQLKQLDFSNNNLLTIVGCSNNQLTFINVANDNNSALATFSATGNPNICIKIDEGFTPPTIGWSKDASATYSTKGCYVNITDPNFKSYLLANKDINKGANEDEITYTEASYFKGKIVVNNKGITDLKGVEAFINITSLDCRNNKLYNLDVSNNFALKSLLCSENVISELDLSNNTALNYLYCGDNGLTKLNVKNTVLDYLYCGSNSLTKLDVSENTTLTKLLCNDNKLTELKIGENLTRLQCGINKLKSLDVSQSKKLNQLECNDNNLEFLNVANGNNGNFFTFIANGNPNACIKIDAGFTPPNTWVKDASATYNENCKALSTEDITKGEEQLNLYPNPASDFIQIKGLSNPESYTIYNVLGAKVAKGTTLNNERLNIQKLRAGLYVLQFKNGKVVKFIKK